VLGDPWAIRAPRVDPAAAWLSPFIGFLAPENAAAMISEVVIGTIAEAMPQSLSACPDTDLRAWLFVFLFFAGFCPPDVNFC
jgi:hypothetical protein